MHEGTSLRLVFSYGFDEPLVQTCTTSRPMAWTMLDALRPIRLVYLQAATRQGDALRFTRGTADGLYIEALEPRGEGEFGVAIGT